MIDVLRELVARKRPYGSPTEGAVIPYLIGVLPRSAFKWIDGAGNLHVDLRPTWGGEDSRTLFVAHTDTVHREGGTNKVHVDPDGNLCGVDAPLGADDAAGVAILCSMIEEGVPGYYIFTRGEEAGGIGSRYLADEHPDLLAAFDRAIAFDRRGTSDVITYQYGGRCASDEFADALSDALNAQGLMYMPSDKGVYTDTAEFVDFIPECTNISCGYYKEHSKDEWLDLGHWDALRKAAIAIDWDALPVGRTFVDDFDMDAATDYTPDADDLPYDPFTDTEEYIPR